MEIVRQPRIIDIGAERQLFLDDHLIDRMDRVARRVNSPAKHPDNPIYEVNRPWEGNRFLYCNVEYDEGDDVHELWYNVRDSSGANHLCYATSPDGLQFSLPELGLEQYDGSVANNITVLPPPGSLECRVFKDRHTDDSQERYKMVYMKAGGSPGIHVASSADGLRWRAYENNPVIVPTGDGLSTPFWDENYQRYVYYHRPAAGHVLRWANVEEPAAYPTRRIGRSEGFEFMSHLWTDLVEVVTPDERDGPGTEFYYMPVIPYQGAYVGMLIIYHEHTGDPDVLAGFNRTLDVQLTFSRDGKKWERVLDRQTFMVGDEDAWDEKRVYPECALVRGDEVWIYYRGSNIPHGTTGGRIADLVDTEIDGKRMIGDALGLATIRLDGFVSIDSAAEPGSMTTWPLRFDGGDELTVNADASGGELLVEALDMFGKPHEGFTRRECQPVAADAVSHRVRWTDGASLKSLVQPVRLRFTMRDTKLYSFQIA